MPQLAAIALESNKETKDKRMKMFMFEWVGNKKR